MSRKKTPEEPVSIPLPIPPGIRAMQLSAYLDEPTVDSTVDRQLVVQRALVYAVMDLAQAVRQAGAQ